MYVSVAGVVPDALRFELKSVEMGGGLVVRMRVAATVPSTADVAADESYPEAVCRGACAAAREGRRIGRRSEGDAACGRGVRGGVRREESL